MIVELETLLDELARRHARGEPLDVEGMLLKAGDRADELAPLIEAFLARAPRRAPSDEALAYVRSLYYQQLEGGVLDPSRVAASVWEAITEVLGRSRVSLTAPHLGAAAPAAPMYRADRLFEPGEMPTLSASMTQPEPPDDVDALFLGDPDSPQTSR